MKTRKPTKPTRPSVSTNDLAASLNVDPRTLRRWRKLPDAPKNDDPAAWQRFASDNDLGRPASGQMAAARLAKLQAEAGLARLKLAEAEGEVISRDFIEDRLRTNTAKFAQLFRFELTQTLPAQLVGQEIAVIRQLITAALDEGIAKYNEYLGIERVTGRSDEIDGRG